MTTCDPIISSTSYFMVCNILLGGNIRTNISSCFSMFCSSNMLASDTLLNFDQDYYVSKMAEEISNTVDINFLAPYAMRIKSHHL